MSELRNARIEYFFPVPFMRHVIDPCQGRANTFFPITAPAVVYIFPEPGPMVLFAS